MKAVYSVLMIVMFAGLSANAAPACAYKAARDAQLAAQGKVVDKVAKLCSTTGDKLTQKHADLNAADSASEKRPN